MTLCCCNSSTVSSDTSVNTSDKNTPLFDSPLWCANLFYCYIPPTNSNTDHGGELIFTSGLSTRHAQMMALCGDVAGSIVLESKIIGKLQGLQFVGHVQLLCEGDQYAHYSSIFLKTYPYAVFSVKELWVVKIISAKYTDNTLGFGTKLLFPSL